MQYCLANELYSAVDFRDAVIHFSKGIKRADNNLTSVSVADGNSANLPDVKVAKRDLKEIIKHLKGGDE